MTEPTASVLRCLAAYTDRECYGLELIQETRIPSGTLYPILARLLEAELVSSWTEPKNGAGKRPVRTFYKLTPEGRSLVESLAAKWAMVPARGKGK